MKLNQRNIDKWLHGKFTNASSSVDDNMLANILAAHQKERRKYGFAIWMNLILIAAWLIFYIGYFKQQNRFAFEFSNTPAQKSILTKKSSETTLKSSQTPLNATTVNQTDIQIQSTNNIVAQNHTKLSISAPPNLVVQEPITAFETILLSAKTPILYQLYSLNELLLPTKYTNELIGNKPLANKVNDDKNGSKTTKDDKKPPLILRPQVNYFISAGYNHNADKVSKKTINTAATHRNYQNIISGGFESNNGFRLDAGLQFGYKHVLVLAGLNYTHSQQQLSFIIPNWEVPVIDQNGEIRGYIILHDSLHRTETKESVLVQNDIAIPIYISFKQNVAKIYQLELGVGLQPKLKTSPKVQMPGLTDLQTETRYKIKPSFSMPITINAGVYRKFSNYTLGLSGMFTPFYNSKSTLPGQMVLQTKQSTIQLSFIKPLF